MIQYLIPLLLAGFAGIANASAAPATDAANSQILVTVGERGISAADLRKVVGSSPIATQFNTMDEPDQAMIRGRMLKNLIYSEMLYLQALERGIDRRPAVVQEIAAFRDNLLYQRYLQSLRAQMQLPANQQLEKTLADEPDSLAAAQAARAAIKFTDIKKAELLRLGKQQHLHSDRQPLQLGQRDPQAIIANSDSFTIHLGDLLYTDEDLQTLDRSELLRRLDNRVSQRLMTDAAAQQGLDVDAQVQAFRRDLLRETLMKEKETAWVPDRAALQAYYDQHPELSRIAEQWRIGQLVVADQAQAEALRQRIVGGESLFALASEHSIDPYGRQNAGEMGWVRPDQAPGAMRKALAELPNDAVSEVIETPRGFHLVIIQDRKPGSQKSLDAVAGGIRRSLILENLALDYEQLSQKYPIQWQLSEHR